MNTFADDAPVMLGRHRGSVLYTEPNGTVCVELERGGRRRVSPKALKAAGPKVRMPPVRASVETSEEAESLEEARERAPRTPPVVQPKPETPRSEAFLDLVRSKPCAACGKRAPDEVIQAHHFTTGGMSLKGSDLYCAPLCLPCHGYDVREGNRRCFPDHSHLESMALLWRAAAKCLAEFLLGARRRR